MRRRRLIIIIIVLAVLSALVWISVSLSRSGRGPIPVIVELLQSTESQTTTDEVTTTQAISVTKTVKPISAQPVTILQYLPKSGRFLAYGLNDQTIYFINSSGVSLGLYRHASSESFGYAVASADENNLIISTSVGVYVLHLSDGSKSVAPANVTTANWLPNGKITYAYQQSDKVSVYVTAASSFDNPTEVARVPSAYSTAALLPSPNGQMIAVVGNNGLMEDGIGAQIIYLNENTISKYGSDIASATWSPDSKYLFGISSTDIVNPEDPTMLAWNVATKDTVSYQPARWFPHSLYSYPGKDSVYWTVQSGRSGETDDEIWAVTVVDTTKQASRSSNLTADANGSLALFGITDSAVIGAGSDVAYQTAVKPFLDAAQAILP